ncbi:MAG: hypothetical protein IK068_04200 [Lachnospiraceae bacterium]|nr:hypothetical protein [Lachnospiraceae bacterium]
MAFGKKNDTPMMINENVAAPAPEVKAKKDKKSKVKYLEPNQMNFLDQYKTVVEGKKKDLDLAKILKPLIAILLVVLAAFVLLEVVLIGFKAKNKSLDKYINDANNIASYNEAIAVKEETDVVNAQKANMESLLAAIDSYPNVGKDFFAKVAATATKDDISVTSYNYSNDTGYLVVFCTANDTAKISQFVRDMEANGLFKAVEYTGFQSNGENGYSFNVNCVCLGDPNYSAAETGTEG